MYPVPSSAAGWKPGTTEEYIGTWIEQNPTLRSEIILATKIAGFNPGSETGGNRFVPPKPSADCRLDRESVLMACDASLRRLRTDYIDLYQLHWPDRYAPNFGQSVYDPTKERDAVPIKETVAALGELIAAGKIRHYGLSNETTFGVCEFVRAADELGVPRPVSIQNSFCLLHRTFETELAEACAPSHYDIGLLPWTPLAGGALSGKYLHGKKPAEGRLVKFPAFMQRYLSAPCVEATEAYEAIAKEAGGVPRDALAGVVPNPVVLHFDHHRRDHDGTAQGEHRRVRRRPGDAERGDAQEDRRRALREEGPVHDPDGCPAARAQVRNQSECRVLTSRRRADADQEDVQPAGHLGGGHRGAGEAGRGVGLGQFLMITRISHDLY